MKSKVIFSLLATILVGACADSPTQVATPAESLVPVDAGADLRLPPSTWGIGQAQLPPGFSALEFAYFATQRRDGSGLGAFRYRWESASGITDIRGRVTCVSFDAALGRAWIGGIITQNNSTNPAVQTAIHQPGRDAWFRVVDNGEGPHATPDRTTVIGFEGAAGIATSAQYCSTRPWAANDANTWEVIEGNIQVKP